MDNSPPLDTQIEHLTAWFGRPLMRMVSVGTAAFWDDFGRSAEVCMILRRKSGLILTLAKTFYPPGVSRLLTGGVEPGETIHAALLREVHEETGLLVTISRFLAVIAYHSEHGHPNGGGMPQFYTFAFLLDEVGGTLGTLDPHEHVLAFREIPVDELPTIADILDHLPAVFSPELDGYWHEWGRFRAIVHREVWQLLAEREPYDQ
jgi:NAD+ diphosphatase